MRRFLICFIVVVFAAQVKSGPHIKIHPEVYKCGEVNESKTKIVKAHYTVSNTGDSILRLHSVKPGCGCTVVKYDSLIAPGAKSTIFAEVDISEYSGHLYKGITVLSNDEESPQISLSIDAVIVSPLSITPRYIAGGSGSVVEIAIGSTKKDLHITAVHFRTVEKQADNEPGGGISDTTLKFELSRDNNTEAKSERVTDYRLKIFLPGVPTLTNGKFVIYTDHPDRKKIEVIGSISL